MNAHRIRTGRGLSTLCLLAALVFSGAACEKQDKIIVQNITPTEVNKAPSVIAFGPEMPAGGFAQSTYSPIGVDLWVLAGDPNGLDDISLVTMDMDSVRLVRYIVRPDTSKGTCIQYGFGPGDTLDTNAILPVPATFPGVKFRPLQRMQGGLFEAEGLGRGFGFPDIVDASPVLQNLDGYCGSSLITSPFNVLPPAVPSPRRAAVSYMELEYYGVKVTVYDIVGATASAVYPTLRLTMRYPAEPTPLP